MVRSLVVAALLLTVLFAGCAEDPNAQGSETSTSSSSATTTSSSSTTTTASANTTTTTSSTSTTVASNNTTSSSSTTTSSSSTTTTGSGNGTGNGTGNSTTPQPTQTFSGEFVAMNPTACSASAATGYLGLGDLDGIGVVLADILPQSVGGTFAVKYTTTAPPAGLIMVFFKGSAGAGTVRSFPAAADLTLRGTIPDSDSVYIDACGGGEITIAGAVMPRA